MPRSRRSAAVPDWAPRRSGTGETRLSVGGRAGLTEPRDLTDLVPNNVRADWRSRCLNSMAWRSPKRCGSLTRRPRRPGRLWVEPTDDEWRLADRIDRGWDAASRLGSTLDPPGRALSAVTPEVPAALFRVLRTPWQLEHPGRLTPPRPGCSSPRGIGRTSTWCCVTGRY